MSQFVRELLQRSRAFVMRKTATSRGPLPLGVVRPLRAEVLSKDLLAVRGAELAEYYSNVQIKGRAAKLRQRFRENTRVLNEVYFYLSEASRNKQLLPAGAEWLLDNFHVIDEQVRDIRRDLPRAYYQTLPKLTDGEWKGYPRVYRLVSEFISHTDSDVDVERLTTFVTAYQSKVVLHIGEIWAVPIMLRLALVENLRRLAEVGLVVSEQRRFAEELCEQTVDDLQLSGAELLMQFVEQVHSHPALLDYGAGYLLRKLRARGSAATLCLQWLGEQLRERGIEPDEVDRVEQQSQAVDQVSVGNAVTALKAVGNLNWRKWFEEVSIVDGILSKDPAQLYARSDFETRDMCRHRVEKLARRARRPEVEVAKTALYIAERASTTIDAPDAAKRNHVGYYLLSHGLTELEAELRLDANLLIDVARLCRRYALECYLGAVGLLMAIALLIVAVHSVTHGGGLLWTLVALVLLVLPLSEWAILVVQWVSTLIASPRPIPKLDFEEGILGDSLTAIVVQTIVPEKEAIVRVIESLEIRALGNPDSQLCYGILADFADAPTEVLSGDLGILNQARQSIARLNERYCAPDSPRFFIMFRKRLWNSSEHAYMGWERKRGKIMEFNRYLRGASDTSFSHVFGDEQLLRKIRYVITLDNDTQLPPGSARKLVSAIAHPLNAPIHDPVTKRVIDGYALIQPRVGITLPSANSSLFASLFSGNTGLDPYTRTVSDVYQDVFGEGSYIGKGVYDVDAFEAALEGRFPENALLSHDLLEGLFVRCGLASDIELFDEFPERYHAQAKRQHRWMRGDWQLLPWLGTKVPNAAGELVPTCITALGRWKLFDNLRRSLVAPSLFLLIAHLLFGAPGGLGWWAGLIAVVVGFQVYSLLWPLLVNFPFGYSLSAYYSSLLADFKRTTLLTALQLVLIPHQAFIAVHATAVTLNRLRVTKRNLLEWETAYSAERRLGRSVRDFVKAMTGQYFLLGPAAVLVLLGTSHFLSALLIFTVWAAAPAVAWFVSQLRPTAEPELDSQSKEYLRGIAYSTWKYFDTYLCKEYNYLIPDNLQLVPKRVVAERTSPTNISLSVLSVISACDLGFIPIPKVLDRIVEVFRTLSRLETFHGHFLNWYSITDLRPLAPRYISTVDSGNLVGHFIAVRETLKRYPYQPLLTDEHLTHLEWLFSAPENQLGTPLRRQSIHTLRGVLDKLSLLENIRRSDAKLSEDTRKALEELDSLTPLMGWTRYLPFVRSLSERGILPKKVERIDRILDGRIPTLSLLSKLVDRLLKIEGLQSSLQLNPEEQQTLNSFVASLHFASDRLRQLDEIIWGLCAQIEQMVADCDFKFLFDPQKKLFVIGYNIDNGQRDNSYYDLLASEARLASIVAVAKGEVPQGHWFRLNRGLTDSPGGRALISWAGTMFEYLMPVLMTKDFPSTLLAETYRAVIKAQRFYGQRRGVPWGISESGYSGVDFERTYQYKAFGIPGLGLKRGLGEDLVVSPYSTALAVMIDPVISVANLRRLEADGIRGEFGFYEAVDYSAERLGAGERCHVVKSFFAHHQGMSLVAINNALYDNVFQERFHANPAIKACELLLQERFPSRIPVIFPHQAEVLSVKVAGDEGKAEFSEVYHSANTKHPYTRLLSNGRYSTLLTTSGSGLTFFESDIQLHRAKDDWVSNDSGSFIYIRDLRQPNEFWSSSYQPSRTEPEEYTVVFSPDKVEYKRRDKGISLTTEITVSPEDNVDVKRITVTNLSDRLRELELTSFAEVALATRRADGAHPAFSKMFVQSEFIEEFGALLFVRKPRTEHDSSLFLFHLSFMPIVWAPVQYETDRERFFGRGGSVHNPAALRSRLTGSTGTTLDPVYALRQKVEVEEGESQTVSFVTGIARSRDEALALIRKYREGQSINRAFEMAWSHSHIEIRHQQFSIASVRDFQRLVNALCINFEHLRGSEELAQRNTLSQAGLWRFGISGDEPIVLLVISNPEQLKLAQEVLLAHEYLRLRGVRFDLVILNEYASGYMQDLQNELELLIRTGFSRHLAEKRGGVFLRSASQLSVEEVSLLHAVARVVFLGSRGSLSLQLLAETKTEIQPPVRLPQLGTDPINPPDNVTHWNGFGGFVDNGKAYRMVVRDNHRPPLPWSNVIANERFGFLVTETGAGYTWAENSRENRLTSWSNDPVTDPHSEAIYLRDQETGEYWNPTPGPVSNGTLCEVTHGFGYSTFKSKYADISSELVISGCTKESVKWWNLELYNHGSRERVLDILLYVDWVLGVSRADTFRFIRSGFDADREILWATNSFNLDYPAQCLFLGSNLKVQGYTGNRKEFIGPNRDLSCPLALDAGVLHHVRAQRFGQNKSPMLQLQRKVGTGLDTAGIIRLQRNIQPGERVHVLLYLGRAENLSQAREKATVFKSLAQRTAALNHVQQYWNEVTGDVTVRSPEPSFDYLLNGWLQYQTVSCRMNGRTGFYQSSGALGFRDQLQDSLSVQLSLPERTRNQILLHASRQFVQGDVQHWWHPPTGRGIRTKISDNYLWLPYAVLDYLKVSGDESVLSAEAPYLEGPELEPHQHEIYFTPTVSGMSGTVYQHCVQALDRSLVTGEHGLPLIGCGDWNDGMNAVGIEGKGESVWLGWFVAYILKHFAPVCERNGDPERAERYRTAANALVRSIEQSAWDGNWYLRAFFDDGSPMGSARGTECTIDSLTQSWAILTGLGNPERCEQAFQSVLQHLVDDELRLVKLLTPAFEHHQPNPGYIQSYPPGIRENGGQYTHAATWVIMAAAALQQGDTGFTLFQLINPITHAETLAQSLRYKTEPYVTCGDVYTNPQHAGRGGWSWYTGSAGWLYRAGIESILGLKVRGSHIKIEPCIPVDWKEYQLSYSQKGTTYLITIKNPEGKTSGVRKVLRNGTELTDGLIPLTPDSGEVKIEVTL